METKKLGFGLMRLPLTDKNDPTSIDHEQLCLMVDSFLKNGFTYFDTAWMYCSFKSEEAIKQALVLRHPRESYTLADKLHAAFLETKEDRDRIFNEQLRKTGVEYFDYYLIHDVGEKHYKIYKQLECFEWLAEKKKSGLVKKMGFSFHDNADVLDRVLSEHPEVDFVQLQINYLDWESEGVQSRKCYEVACKYNKPVIVMEPVKGGTLAKVAPKIEEMFKNHRPDLSVPSWAIRFTADLDNVFMVLSGMSNMQQLNDNMSYMSYPEHLSDEEHLIIKRAVSIINSSTSISCTGCAYCIDGCPKNIPIPKYFSLYNADRQESDKKDWTPQNTYYQNLLSSFGSPDDCVECGQCEAICPQHLTIIKHLKEISNYFG